MPLPPDFFWKSFGCNLVFTLSLYPQVSLLVTGKSFKIRNYMKEESKVVCHYCISDTMCFRKSFRIHNLTLENCSLFLMMRIFDLHFTWVIWWKLDFKNLFETQCRKVRMAKSFCLQVSYFLCKNCNIEFWILHQTSKWFKENNVCISKPYSNDTKHSLLAPKAVGLISLN